MFKVLAPVPAFGKPCGSIRFGDIVDSKNRRPTLSFSGRAGSSVLEYDGRYSFKMDLNEADLEKVMKLDEFLNNPDNAEEIGLPGDYEHRSCLNIDNQITIKLKEKNGGWAFKCNNFDTSAIEYGDKVTVKVTPGFYFAEEDKRFGVYFSLKELVFPKSKKM